MIACNDNQSPDELFAEQIADTLSAAGMLAGDRDVVLVLVRGLLAQDEGSEHLILASAGRLMREMGLGGV